MLVRFCKGYVNPEEVEAIIPSANGESFILVTRGGNKLTLVGADHNMIKNDLAAAGMLRKLEGSEKRCAEK